MTPADDVVTGVERPDAMRARPGKAAPRGRLARKYALLFIALVGAALLINSGLDFWFSYQENKAALVRVQQEKADAAAQRIEEFVEEIRSQIGWTARTRRRGRDPRARQRHRHPAGHQGQAVPAVLHDQADGRGHRARAVDQLRHRDPAA
jgi:hypothetical protein